MLARLHAARSKRKRGTQPIGYWVGGLRARLYELWGALEIVLGLFVQKEPLKLLLPFCVKVEGGV